MTKSVLYVDDETDNLTVFKSSFRNAFNIITSESAERGLELIESNDVRVVISDQRMPGMSGVEFLEKIKNRYPDVIRIVLTAYTESEDIIDAINRGAVYSFIKKPWNSTMIKQTIDESLLQFELRLQSRKTIERLYHQTIPGSQDQNVDEILDPHTRFHVDEELLYVLAQFPEQNSAIHRLFFTADDFRELCRDYFECSQIVKLQDQAEFEELKQELEKEILSLLN